MYSRFIWFSLVLPQIKFLGMTGKQFLNYDNTVITRFYRLSSKLFFFFFSEVLIQGKVELNIQWYVQLTKGGGAYQFLSACFRNLTNAFNSTYYQAFTMHNVWESVVSEA